MKHHISRTDSYTEATIQPLLNATETLNDGNTAVDSKKPRKIGERQKFSDLMTEHWGAYWTPRDPDEKQLSPKDGPSSFATVMLVSFFFVVGFLLVCAGTIVLTTSHHRVAECWTIAGAVLITLGTIFWLICLVLQRKNCFKHIHRLENQFFH